MRNNLPSFVAIAVASLASGFFTLYITTSGSIQFVAVFLIVVLFTSVYLRYAPSLQGTVVTRIRGILLLLSTFLIQILVIITGALFSPFLILFHIYTIALSLIFRFSVGVFFLMCSVSLLLGHMYLDPTLHNSLFQDPGSLILYFITFLTIVPLAQILGQRYHLHDSLFKVLTNEVKIEETIMEEIHELVFVTDNNTRILSINDAVEKSLHRSRSELLSRLLFDVLFIKDTTGQLLTKDTLFSQMQTAKKEVLRFPDTLLLTSQGTNRRVTLQVKPIGDLEGTTEQLSFILSENTNRTSATSANQTIEETRMKHEAMIEELKQTLYAKGLVELGTKVHLIKKIEDDIQNFHQITDEDIAQETVLLDLAQLSREIVAREQDFAAALHVPLKFEFKNFGQADVEKISTKLFKLLPEQVTGPFFTVPCDVKHTELLLQKLIDISALLSASEVDPQVIVSIERQPQVLIIAIRSNCSKVSKEQVEAVFTKYYDALGTTTKLSLGSGLEGYLAKTIAAQLSIPLETVITSNPAQITFSLTFAKTSNPLTH